MPRATAETIGKSLIASIDAFAAELRKQAKVTESPLIILRLARWWRWIWIRHRVGADEDDEGHVLADRKVRRGVGELGHPISPRSPSAQLLVVKGQDDSGDALPSAVPHDSGLGMATLV